MSEPPSERAGFWIDFACLFVAVGSMLALFAWKIWISIDSSAAIAMTAIVCLLMTTAISFFTAHHSVGDPPPLQWTSPFWGRFIFSYVIFEVLSGFMILRGFHRVDSPAALGIAWFLATTAGSVYAARHGDNTWGKVFGFFQW
jgi:hypothetical protein